MILMHTSLPEFKLKMHMAVVKQSPDKTLKIRGIENLRSAKMQSLRTGRIESAVEEVAKEKEVKEVEMVVMPRVPETMHTVIVKGLDKDGKAIKAILEVINIIHPTEEVELAGIDDVQDRRPPIGKH